MASLAAKRVVVTGGSGFLGRHVVAALGTRGCTVLVPRKAQYDLTHIADVERMYADLRPDIVLHLAAVVGGINRVAISHVLSGDPAPLLSLKPQLLTFVEMTLAARA